ncbi:DUF1236 domain-containing protein [Ensifer adhaerens]|jgi:hypothetical protein|uniref:DUF1236 domain-containing protein n=1 Tax=Ensifer adhaerens TaxID=106592 RepID=A0A9Q8YE77_ENSAD|nr:MULTISPECIES: DUF1236 domain-containing protein [Ensifer]KSV66203.1 hypothetical protein N182_35350 [Sinorhizobium sp. GL2]KQX05909.1 hypothetical protein ASD01_09855 [Ensifer sp. Root423]MBD9493987.1 DUF1236 domain-containing protein [Ensifer sp. ENS01]MBD9520509.1 DUF1236 domain-containing protein [Ensifer sp. ENS02]MBD9570613.1 DUF1236 domain-containing protein [Ensifer sp. ENS08]
MKKLIIAAAVVSLMAGSAFAEDANQKAGTAAGIVGGATAGAVVGGPIGAGVGAVVGGALGGALTPPPPEVITYVEQQPAPPSVVVQEQVVIGKPIPQAVVLTPVPDNPRYAYAVVNDHRVIVEPQSRTVVQVIN